MYNTNLTREAVNEFLDMHRDKVFVDDMVASIIAGVPQKRFLVLQPCFITDYFGCEIFAFDGYDFPPYIKGNCKGFTFIVEVKDVRAII